MATKPNPFAKPAPGKDGKKPEPAGKGKFVPFTKKK